MTGSRRPACCATSVNRALNGMPEGLPRCAGATPREATPWAQAAEAGAIRSVPKLRRLHDFVPLKFWLRLRIRTGSWGVGELEQTGALLVFLPALLSLQPL